MCDLKRTYDSHGRSPKTSDRLRAGHVRAEIGPQEKNETTPKRHDIQTRGKLFQRQLHCLFLHELPQLAQRALGDERTVTGAYAIIADISKNRLCCTTELKAG